MSSLAPAFLLSNLIWFVGVLFFGWKAFDLLFLFWLETRVMEIFVVAKMILFGSLWKVEWEPLEKRAKFTEDDKSCAVPVIVPTRMVMRIDVKL